MCSKWRYSKHHWPNVVRCRIWYHVHNLKSVKNTHGGVLLLVKLQASVCKFTKINTPPWVFSTFFKLYEWYQIEQRTTYSNIRHDPRNKYNLRLCYRTPDILERVLKRIALSNSTVGNYALMQDIKQPEHGRTSVTEGQKWSSFQTNYD